MKLLVLQAARVLMTLILILPAAGYKNEQKQTAAENKQPLTRQDLEEVLGKRKRTPEEEEARKQMKSEAARKIEEYTKGYDAGGRPIKNEEEQAKTP